MNSFQSAISGRLCWIGKKYPRLCHTVQRDVSLSHSVDVELLFALCHVCTALLQPPLDSLYSRSKALCAFCGCVPFCPLLQEPPSTSKPLVRTYASHGLGPWLQLLVPHGGPCVLCAVRDRDLGIYATAGPPVCIHEEWLCQVCDAESWGEGLRCEFRREDGCERYEPNNRPWVNVYDALHSRHMLEVRSKEWMVMLAVGVLVRAPRVLHNSLCAECKWIWCILDHAAAARTKQTSMSSVGGPEALRVRTGRRVRD